MGGFAAAVSYSHIYDLARLHGQTVTDARLLPLSVDGLIVAASFVLLHEARAGRVVPRLARWMLAVGVITTLAANVLYGLHGGAYDALMSACPLGKRGMRQRPSRSGPVRSVGKSLGPVAPYWHAESYATMHVSSQVWEILEDGYKANLLEQDALESLANLIGFCRYGDEDYPDFIDPESELDARAAHLALYIVTLGYEGQLGRMMGNARFGHPKHMPHRLAMHNDISEDTYSKVAKILGYKSWPKN